MSCLHVPNELAGLSGDFVGGQFADPTVFLIEH